jgi:hypothetical protein
MFRELTAIQSVSSDENQLRLVLQQIDAYLRQDTQHCLSYQLIKHTTIPGNIILQCLWQTPYWHHVAWRYFMDVFNAVGMVYTINSTVTAEEDIVTDDTYHLVASA